MEIVFLVHANGPNKSLSTRTESLPSKKLDVSSTMTTLLLASWKCCNYIEI